MLISDFDFNLPEHLIAQTAAERGQSRLLALDRGSGALAHHAIADLPALLRPGDALVVNDTRVFAARLLGHRVPSGGAVECLLLSAKGEHVWEALMHPGQKLKPGALVRFERNGVELMAEVLERHFQGRRTIRLWSESTDDVTSLIDTLGHVPLPPYIRRDDTPADRERYQTVYARSRGSVAAPTAGLHFTTELLDALSARGIERIEITLHVGYGTFKPVKVDHVEDHVVDAEGTASATTPRGVSMRRGKRGAGSSPLVRRRRGRWRTRRVARRPAARCARARPWRTCSSIPDSSFRWSMAC
jgi:S-adenosylmethionine:tRNA ribosyltransferase-isomerase